MIRNVTLHRVSQRHCHYRAAKMNHIKPSLILTLSSGIFGLDTDFHTVQVSSAMAKMDIEIYEKLLTDSNPKPGYYVEGGRMRRLKDRDRFDGEDLEFDDDDSEFGIPVLSFTSGQVTSGLFTISDDFLRSFLIRFLEPILSSFVELSNQTLLIIKQITLRLWTVGMDGLRILTGSSILKVRA